MSSSTNIAERQSAAGADITDWSGMFRLGPHYALRQPEDEAALQEIIHTASGRVRALGSRLSQRSLLTADGDEVLLDLVRFDGLLSADGDTATFAAATRLEEVHRILAETGRMLPCCPGVISRQTLAGALATGTHGQGLGQSSFADTVTRFRLVLADGRICEIARDHPWFNAAQLSLGALGIVTAVTLRTVPTQIFTCLKRSVEDAALETDLVFWARTEAYCKAWWFPESRRVHLWLGREAHAEEVALYEAGGRGLVALTKADQSLNDAIDHTLHYLRHDTKDQGEGGDQFRTLKRFRDVSDVTGDLFQIFCNGIAVPQVNLEIAVPLEHAGTVIGRLRAWHDAVRPRLHYPIILRCTGPSSAWLSPAQGEPVCYFGFVVYYAQDGSIAQDGLDFLAAVEKIIAAAGGRPHWAKHFNPGLYAWKDLYPAWEKFTAVRAAADPGGKFTNRFIRDLLEFGA